MRYQGRFAGIFCAALTILFTQAAFAAKEKLPTDDTLQTRLWDVRLEALTNDAASGKTAGDYQLGNLDISQYYREASLLELEAAGLSERTAALEDELYERGEPAGVMKNKLGDAQSRYGRNQRRREANKNSYDNGGYVTERKYYIELLPLAREAHAIADETAMLRWQAENWEDADYNALNESLWEARYLSYCNRRDLEAIEYGQQTGALTREKYLSLLKQLEAKGRQVQNKLDEAQKALDRRDYRESGVIREFDYNDYHKIVTRLDEIEDELMHLEWKWEDRTISYGDYKESKKELEKERQQLTDEKRTFGYHDDLH